MSKKLVMICVFLVLLIGAWFYHMVNQEKELIKIHNDCVMEPTLDCGDGKRIVNFLEDIRTCRCPQKPRELMIIYWEKQHGK